MELKLEPGGYYGSKSGGGGGAPNLYSGANAADPGNEVNGTANTRTGGGAWTITSSNTPAAFNGSWYLRFQRETPNGLNADGKLDLSGMPTGVPLTIKIHTNQITGSNFQLRLTAGDGWATLVTQTVSGSGWTEHTLIGTANIANPLITVRGQTGGATGDVLGIDNIIITQ